LETLKYRKYITYEIHEFFANAIGVDRLYLTTSKGNFTIEVDRINKEAYLVLHSSINTSRIMMEMFTPKSKINALKLFTEELQKIQKNGWEFKLSTVSILKIKK
jgi:hypothetical protein